MDIQLINIGFGNIVSANRVVAIVSPESAPIKRIITDARDRGQLIDATYGRRTRAVIITDSSHVILSAIQPETVANRFVITRDHHQAVDNWLKVGRELHAYLRYTSSTMWIKLVLCHPDYKSSLVRSHSTNG